MLAIIGNLILNFAIISNTLLIIVAVKALLFRNLLFFRRIVFSTIFWQFFLCITATAILLMGFITSDYNILSVYKYSHSSMPITYKIGALWGNHEGSILLWSTLLATFNLAFLLLSKFESYIKAKILLVQLIIYLCFITFTTFLSNPFIYVKNSLEGQGLNPLLQDIGLTFHPPILYLGYVSCSILYSLAIISLLDRNFSSNYFNKQQSWITMSWIFMTCGIASGSWWAYRELGWGGFWFWDPVETCSLLPWLSLTALIHSNKISYLQGKYKNWTLALSLISFISTLLGTFLVRSGILTSVHNFATDPNKGIFILAIIMFFVVTALIIYSINQQYIISKPFYKNFSKEAGILLNNLLLMTLFSSAILGIIYPLFYELFTTKIITIGTPYYTTTFMPITAVTLFFCVIYSLSNWNQNRIRLKIIFYSAILSFILITIIFIYLPKKDFFSYLYLFISFLLFISMILLFLGRSSSNKANIPMIIAHLAIAIISIGIIFSTTWHEERILNFRVGDKQKLSSYEITLNDVQLSKKQNYISVKPIFTSEKNNYISKLEPESRFYNVEKTLTSEINIKSNIIEDFAINIAEVIDKTNIIAKVQIRPFMNFIWLGAIILLIAGLYSLIKLTRN